MKRPNFFIVGAPKCGTTALAEYLREHPKAFVTQPKEPHYFSTDFSYYYAPGHESLDHYLELYEGASPTDVAVGEGSVWYLYSRRAAAEIIAFNPDARFIAMVRNPLEMVPSLHSQMLYMRDETEEDLGRAWALREERREGRSIPPTCRVPEFLDYGEAAKLGTQVQRLLETVPEQQVKLIVFDDLRADTGRVYAEVLQFLGLPDDGRRQFEAVNANKEHRTKLIARLTQRPPRPLIAAATAVKRVTGIKRLGVLNRLRQSNRRAATRQELSPELARELREYFAEDVALLGRLTGRDLGYWLA